MKFTATEAGFKDGLGGASNSKGKEKYHCVIFGHQEDPQHPEYTGAYFEYDDQSNGAVNCVKEVSISNKLVVFKLKKGESIEVGCNVSAEQWEDFLRGISTVFSSILHP
jgi:hypothetical protein